MGLRERLVLSDAQWARTSEHVISDERSRGSSGRDNRMFVEAVLWIVRTGSPWRDLPEAFGNWNSAFRRFSRWSEKGIWRRIFAAMADDRISNARSSTAPSFAPTSTLRGPKGGLKIRPLAAPAAA